MTRDPRSASAGSPLGTELMDAMRRTVGQGGDSSDGWDRGHIAGRYHEFDDESEKIETGPTVTTTIRSFTTASHREQLAGFRQPLNGGVALSPSPKLIVR